MSTTRISGTDSGMRLTFVRISSLVLDGGVPGQERDLDRTVGGELGVHERFDPGTEALGQGVELEVHPSRQRLHVPAGDRVPHSFQITPHRTWSAVCVRIRAWRRSQSIVAVNGDADRRPIVTRQRVPHAPVAVAGLADVDDRASPPSHVSTPVSWGWPPPVT